VEERKAINDRTTQIIVDISFLADSMLPSDEYPMKD